MSIAAQRHDIKEEHENALVQAFAKYLNDNGQMVRVLPRNEEPSLVNSMATDL